MRSYPNIEKSRFRHGEYVGWDAKGNRYAIKKNGPNKERGSWWVYPRVAGTTDAPAPNTTTHIPCFYAGTLALVSLRLERMSAICAMPRLPHEVKS